MSNETLCGLQFQSHHVQPACKTTVITQITDKAYNSFVFVILYQKNVLLNPTLHNIKNNMQFY
jgi:hypothetical protein